LQRIAFALPINSTIRRNLLEHKAPFMNSKSQKDKRLSPLLTQSFGVSIVCNIGKRAHDCNHQQEAAHIHDNA
jgi:hypothetical protein